MLPRYTAPTPLEYFASLVHSDAEFALLEAAASIAQDEYPELDVQQLLYDMDSLQARLQRRRRTNPEREQLRGSLNAHQRERSEMLRAYPGHRYPRVASHSGSLRAGRHGQRVYVNRQAFVAVRSVAESVGHAVGPEKEPAVHVEVLAERLDRTGRILPSEPRGGIFQTTGHRRRWRGKSNMHHGRQSKQWNAAHRSSAEKRRRRGGAGRGAARRIHCHKEGFRGCFCSASRTRR